MSDPGPLWLPARAKLNLVLRVVGRRADGYHLLETLFHALELHDDLTLERTGAGVELELTADDPALVVSAGPDNLVQRALQRFLAAAGVGGGFRARLHKRIPHGGGLGGGSSDAAAALRLANALHGAPLAEPELLRLCSTLGADVAFFVRSGSQWGRGIGDELSPALVPPQHFVLLLPPFGCPTVDVYKSHAALWQRAPYPATVLPITVPETGNAAVRITLHNDLEPAAELVRPELAELRRAVVRAGYPEVRMTGSGSTLFVAAADAAAAARVEAALAAVLPGEVRRLVTASGPSAPDQPRSPHGDR
ncbi:MAG: 4-(cytidine 5'-diphospho)-2-C-methyl-D-erythritol kinase [Planctomycetes bacterium]|jgi:4-diphosphocytidyl-2-C-methyl-D-erythritol kinase|nr:4-(cytidine 5'-diphospho)-2-C-methyl-D-erythritol kinase [Planctomycetota bacterium]